MIERKPAGVRAIILYKMVKGAAGLIVGGTFATLGASGRSEIVRDVAHWIRHHVSANWSRHLADALVSHATRTGVTVTGLALVLDALLTTIEGWALSRGHWWGPWLVVVTTSSLLPFEVYEIARHARAIRVLALIVNVAIVVYLARRAMRERRA